jgi:glycosyltransferase involved in cell wall biosynthesis
LKKKRIKVLVVNVSHHCGGAELVLLRFFNKARNEIEPTYLIPEGVVAQKVKELGFNCKIIPFFTRINHDKNLVLASTIFLRNYCVLNLCLFWNLITGGFALVEANNAFAVLYSFILPTIMRKRFIWTHHDIVPQKNLRRTLGIIARISSSVVCVSDAVQKTLPQSLKIVRIYNSFEGSAENLFSAPEKIGVFGYVGLVCEEKGIFEVVKAFSKMKGKGIRLKIFGQYNSLRDESILHDLISELKISSECVYCGYKPTTTIFNEIDCLIQYSLVEDSLPTTILEAMFYKKIVIGSKRGGIPELISNEYNGFLVGNLLELSRVISNVVTLPKNRIKEISDNATRVLKLKFNPQAQYEMRAAIYTEMSNRK